MSHRNCRLFSDLFIAWLMAHITILNYALGESVWGHVYLAVAAWQAIWAVIGFFARKEAA